MSDDLVKSTDRLAKAVPREILMSNAVAGIDNLRHVLATYARHKASVEKAGDLHRIAQAAARIRHDAVTERNATLVDLRDKHSNGQLAEALGMKRTNLVGILTKLRRK